MGKAQRAKNILKGTEGNAAYLSRNSRHCER